MKWKLRLRDGVYGSGIKASGLGFRKTLVYHPVTAYRPLEVPLLTNILRSIPA